MMGVLFIWLSGWSRSFRFSGKQDKARETCWYSRTITSEVSMILHIAEMDYLLITAYLPCFTFPYTFTAFGGRLYTQSDFPSSCSHKRFLQGQRSRSGNLAVLGFWTHAPLISSFILYIQYIYSSSLQGVLWYCFQLTDGLLLVHFRYTIPQGLKGPDFPTWLAFLFNSQSLLSKDYACGRQPYSQFRQGQVTKWNLEAGGTQRRRNRASAME